MRLGLCRKERGRGREREKGLVEEDDGEDCGSQIRKGVGEVRRPVLEREGKARRPDLERGGVSAEVEDAGRRR